MATFDLFLEAKGVKKDSQRKALLLHCAGQDVQDIFDTLTDPGPFPEHDSEYSKAMRSLDAHFAHQVNIFFEWHQFRQAKQEESETVDQFVLRLFQLSENCEFGEAKEVHIRDQLIDKCRSHNLRKKLLEASGTLTLQKAREIARSTEAAESQARLIENDSKGDSVHALEDKQAEYGTRKTHETRNARPDLLLAKNVRRLDTSQSFVGPRAKIKPRKETSVMSPRTTTLHLQFN